MIKIIMATGILLSMSGCLIHEPLVGISATSQTTNSNKNINNINGNGNQVINTINSGR